MRHALALDASETPREKPSMLRRLWLFLEQLEKSQSEHTLDHVDDVSRRVRALELKTARLETLIEEARQ